MIKLFDLLEMKPEWSYSSNLCKNMELKNLDDYHLAEFDDLKDKKLCSQEIKNITWTNVEKEEQSNSYFFNFILKFRFYPDMCSTYEFNKVEKTISPTLRRFIIKRRKIEKRLKRIKLNKNTLYFCKVSEKKKHYLQINALIPIFIHDKAIRFRNKMIIKLTQINIRGTIILKAYKNY